jgi:hypothetical protein
MSSIDFLHRYIFRRFSWLVWAALLSGIFYVVSCGGTRPEQPVDQAKLMRNLDAKGADESIRRGIGKSIPTRLKPRPIQ